MKEIFIIKRLVAYETEKEYYRGLVGVKDWIWDRFWSAKEFNSYKEATDQITELCGQQSTRTRYQIDKYFVKTA